MICQDPFLCQDNMNIIFMLFKSALNQYLYQKITYYIFTL